MGTEKKKYDKHEKDTERAFFGKMYFRMSDVADTMFFFSKKYQEIVVFHKQELTMAGTTETERHGTRMGTEKKTRETQERHRTSIFWENVLSHV